MRCWFGRITIPDEAISCVESGWTSCMADMLKELNSLDRFDGPEKGEPWIAQKHADSNNHLRSSGELVRVLHAGVNLV
jgi:hypothetical protein